MKQVRLVLIRYLGLISSIKIYHSVYVAKKNEIFANFVPSLLNLIAFLSLQTSSVPSAH